MKILKCKNEKTGKNGTLEIRDNGFFLCMVTCFGTRKAKFIGKKERTAKRWMSRSNWNVIIPAPENMDIARRRL